MGARATQAGRRARTRARRSRPDAPGGRDEYPRGPGPGRRSQREEPARPGPRPGDIESTGHEIRDEDELPPGREPFGRMNGPWQGFVCGFGDLEAGSAAWPGTSGTPAAMVLARRSSRTRRRSPSSEARGRRRPGARRARASRSRPTLTPEAATVALARRGRQPGDQRVRRRGRRQGRLKTVRMRGRDRPLERRCPGGAGDLPLPGDRAGDGNPDRHGEGDRPDPRGTSEEETSAWVLRRRAGDAVRGGASLDPVRRRRQPDADRARALGRGCRRRAAPPRRCVAGSARRRRRARRFRRGGSSGATPTGPRASAATCCGGRERRRPESPR